MPIPNPQYHFLGFEKGWELYRNDGDNGEQGELRYFAARMQATGKEYDFHPNRQKSYWDLIYDLRGNLRPKS